MGKQQRARRRMTPNLRPGAGQWNPRVKQHGPGITRELTELWTTPDTFIERYGVFRAPAMPGNVDEPVPERWAEMEE